jgi:hypothetical protein
MLLVGYILVRTLSLSTSPLFYILVMAPLGLGAGIFQSPNNSAVMGSAPRSRLGVASSLLSLTRSTGQTIGVSVIGGLWASQAIAMYGKNITDATQTPPVFQIAALHQTTLVIIVLIGLAFLLSLQAFVTEIVQRRKAVLPRQISENLD